ncbi:EFR1 family ferrodoxin [Dethiothermospora halolimnae]|uniref:EFR1 family ferrodoxin n=1 Tax=Dethiothermospora halolimnae TaxID=3114390 RepID=UPI003CCBCE3D
MIINRKINTLYFSATDTTKKVVMGLANNIYKNMDINRNINFTLPKSREQSVSFDKDDIVIVGVPVYAGRVPNVLLKYLNTIKGNGALAIAIVVYGNRNYDDALIELKDILKSDGFSVIAAGAFIGEHSFSKTLAKGRPDREDMDIVSDFAHNIWKKLETNSIINNIEVKGNRPYRKYYMPKDENGNAVDIRKVTPKTNNNCTNCKLCVNLCPMGSIDHNNVSVLSGICIKCGACIKNCPIEAKYYNDEDYLRHKYELEVNLTDRKEPELFI